MWTCKVCKSQIPEGAIACLMCMENRQAKGLRDYQMEFLRRVHRGEFKIVTHRVPSQSTTHVQIFGALRSFCGEPITQIARFKTHISFDDEKAWAAVCPKCAAAVREAMQEALAAVPAESAGA